jgi:hypothetical protein
MARKSDEHKVADILGKSLNQHEFLPFILANHLVNDYPLFTQDRIKELIVAIFEYQQIRFIYNPEDEDARNEGIVFGAYMADRVTEYEEDK